jgi:hypothetical protein
MLENGCRDAPKRLGVAPLKEPQFVAGTVRRRQKNESPGFTLTLNITLNSG